MNSMHSKSEGSDHGQLQISLKRVQEISDYDQTPQHDLVRWFGTSESPE